MIVFKKFRFEAAHLLPHVPRGHKCGRLHGHSYTVRVDVTGPVGKRSGWVQDFADISRAWAPLHDLLDHRYLNDIPGLENPTSERLAEFVWDLLAPTLPGLRRVTVMETCTSGASYDGPRQETSSRSYGARGTPRRAC